MNPWKRKKEPPDLLSALLSFVSDPPSSELSLPFSNCSYRPYLVLAVCHILGYVHRSSSQLGSQALIIAESLELPGCHSGFCTVHALKNRPDLVAFRGVLGFDDFVLFCSVARVWVRIKIYDACRSNSTIVSMADVGSEDQGILHDAVYGVLEEPLSHLQWSLCFFKVQMRSIGPLLTVSSHLHLLLYISDFQVCLLLFFPSPVRIICIHGYCLLASTLKPHPVQFGVRITLALFEVLDVSALWVHSLLIEHSKLWRSLVSVPYGT